MAIAATARSLGQVSHERILDFRAGVLRRRVEWVSPAGQGVRVTSVRLVSLKSWSFIAVEPKESFAGYLEHVSTGPLQLTPASTGNADADKTVSDAFNLGYRPTIVASAPATRDLPVPGGTPVPATTLQTATLAGIADLFAVVAGTPDDLPG